MTEPTVPPIPAPPLPPRLAALVDIVSRMSEYPGLAERLEDGIWTVNTEGVCSIRSAHGDDSANLELCRELFGGEVHDDGELSPGRRWQELRTTWLGVPVKLKFTVTVPEDEVAQLRHRVAELELRLGGLPATQGELDEMRHLVEDPAVPPLAVAGAPPLPKVRAVQASVVAAAAESAEAVL